MSGERTIFDLPSFDPAELPEHLRDKYVVESTGGYSFYSGRSLWKVACKKCGKVLHERTNGPQHLIAMHEDPECHVMFRCTPTGANQ